MEKIVKLFKSVVVLTTTSILLTTGAFVFQIAMGLSGINGLQSQPSSCTDALATVLSHSSSYFIAGLACACISVLLLVLAGTGICCGLTGLDAGSGGKYREADSLNRQSNPPNNDIQEHGSIYFTECKIRLFQISYILGFLAVLAFFGLILCQMVAGFMCDKPQQVPTLVITILAGISCILSLAATIVCLVMTAQLQKYKRNRLQDQNLQILNPVQKMSNMQVSKIDQTHQMFKGKPTNQRKETINSLNDCEDQEDHNYKRERENRNQAQKPRNKKEPSLDYVSFNKNAKNRVVGAVNRNSYEDNKKESENRKESQLQIPSQLANWNQQKNAHQSSGPTNIYLEAHNHKQANRNDRSSQTGTMKDSKDPTPHFIIESRENSALENSNANNMNRNFETFNFKNNQNILVGLHDNQEVEPNIDNKATQLKKSPEREIQSCGKMGNRNGSIESGENRDYGVKQTKRHFLQQNKMEIIEKKKEILRKTGNKPFFRSPHKNKEEEASREPEGNQFNYETRKQTQPIPIPHLSASPSEKKLREEQMKFIQSHKYRQESIQTEKEQRSKDQSIETSQILPRGYPQSRLKTSGATVADARPRKKPSLVIDYIRSKYTG